MMTLYLTCFVLGLVLSLLAAFGGLGRFHFGHLHLHLGGHAPAHGSVPAHGGHLPAVNGFTLPAFLGWFGGAGYLLHRYGGFYGPVVLLLASLAGFLGAGILYAVLFKFLLPHERVLSEEDTRMDGVVGRVSGEIRAGGVGEILYSQADARRGSPARSESGAPIARGTEVVVLRYVRGIAYVAPLEELMERQNNSGPVAPVSSTSNEDLAR